MDVFHDMSSVVPAPVVRAVCASFGVLGLLVVASVAWAHWRAFVDRDVPMTFGEWMGLVIGLCVSLSLLVG
ncbi:hypothetical protein J2W23_000229 [Variovorax boronicumulans]|uniref:hypothetical protein n=1 Tax=Variovorax boronicumulans TaxID=436515 RepID=UPI0027825AA9|nr:hypothetical protein [Variovorax boronicumulans]MDQ0011865.1 hypothetical protein [Variovorax boronicumulans]